MSVANIPLHAQCLMLYYTPILRVEFAIVMFYSHLEIALKHKYPAFFQILTQF